MIWLPDGNALISLVLQSHSHHDRARAWFRDEVRGFATCVITQGTLLRVHMQAAEDGSAAAAWETLRQLCAHPAHTFWPDSFGYPEVAHAHLQGARQVTDAWLAELARRRGARVATFDKAFAMLHPDATRLIP
ncbi:MAG: PIN domain-containing protein [Verrucomicrobiae bacterium]|nr:PIN domain-containing protein [Verrucomicrobiae bacterium]